MNKTLKLKVACIATAVAAAAVLAVKMFRDRRYF